MNAIDIFKADVLECQWDPPTLMLFSDEVAPLVYYTHLLPAFACVCIFLIILFTSRQSLPAKVLMVITSLFTLFALIDLSLWAINDAGQIMFLWSLLTYIEPLIYLACLYLLISFATNQHPSKKTIAAMIILYMPIMLLGPTSLNLAAYDYSNCDRLAIEGALLYYVYFVEIISVIWLFILAKKYYSAASIVRLKRAVIYLMSGLILFLFSFSAGNIIGTVMQEYWGENSWIIGQYGLLGMPIFLAFILYILVNYRSFNSRILGSEALMIGQFILLVSLLFVRTIESSRIIALVTLLIFTLLGYLLVKSVRREVKQREEIEKLADDLSKANKRLRELDRAKSEFVSIASHQLRSPLTAMRGYASMLLDGSYGKLPPKMQPIVEHIADSTTVMISSVEDYLSISRIESGNMKFELSDFNLRDRAQHIAEDLRPEAIKSGLLLLFKSDLKGDGVVHADVGKTDQIIHNLINNAMKYTPKGTISVLVHDNPSKKKLYVEIKDTGIGMSSDTLVALFEKFNRADNANSVNIHGTGLGLFVARSLARAMEGEVTAYSEGDNQGSTFILELPMQR